MGTCTKLDEKLEVLMKELEFSVGTYITKLRLTLNEISQTDNGNGLNQSTSLLKNLKSIAKSRQEIDILFNEVIKASEPIETDGPYRTYSIDLSSIKEQMITARKDLEILVHSAYLLGCMINERAILPSVGYMTELPLN